MRARPPSCARAQGGDRRRKRKATQRARGRRCELWHRHRYVPAATLVHFCRTRTEILLLHVQAAEMEQEHAAGMWDDSQSQGQANGCDPRPHPHDGAANPSAGRTLTLTRACVRAQVLDRFVALRAGGGTRGPARARRHRGSVPAVGHGRTCQPGRAGRPSLGSRRGSVSLSAKGFGARKAPARGAASCAGAKR